MGGLSSRKSAGRVAGVLAALVAAASVTVPAVASADVSPCAVTAEDQAVDAQEQALLSLINQYRQSRGKPALTMHAGVTRAAAWFSRDMATLSYFPYNHVDSNGRSLSQRLSWCGVTYSNWAENIYAGSAEAQRVFDAWRASPGHDANLLRDGVTAAGIARAYRAGSTYGWYWTLDLTNSPAPAPTTTTRPAVTTTTTRPAVTTTTTRPATTTTTRPALTTTTTTRPATTTTTTPPPGTPEWYRWLWRQYLGG